jgi:hypothetical protein
LGTGLESKSSDLGTGLESKSSDLGTGRWLTRQVQTRPKSYDLDSSSDLDSSPVPKDLKIYASVFIIYYLYNTTVSEIRYLVYL